MSSPGQKIRAFAKRLPAIGPLGLALFVVLGGLSGVLFAAPFSGVGPGSIGALAVTPTPSPTPTPDPVVTAVVVTASNFRANTSTSPGFSTVLPGPTTFDLMTVQGVEELLGGGALPAARYNAFRFDVDSVVVTADGVDVEATVPSEVIKLAGKTFEVVAGQTTTVVIDFDVSRSLVFLPGGEIKFKPTVKLQVPPGGVAARFQDQGPRALVGLALQSLTGPFLGTVEAATLAQTHDGTLEIAVTDSSTGGTPILFIPGLTVWTLLGVAALMGVLLLWGLRRTSRTAAT